MQGCIFFIVIIFLIATSASNSKKNNSVGSGSDNVNLDDIFNDVMKVTNQRSSSSVSSQPLVTPPQPSSQSRRTSRTSSSRNTNPGQISRASLTAPTNHGSHICEDVNYDNLSSLEGGTGSFNLAEPEPVATYKQEVKIKIGREDLLKSFIMSEVLQRYDINRIYSRIPPIKNDD